MRAQVSDPASYACPAPADPRPFWERRAKQIERQKASARAKRGWGIAKVLVPPTPSEVASSAAAEAAEAALDEAWAASGKAPPEAAHAAAAAAIAAAAAGRAVSGNGAAAAAAPANAAAIASASLAGAAASSAATTTPAETAPVATASATTPATPAAAGSSAAAAPFAAPPSSPSPPPRQRFHCPRTPAGGGGSMPPRRSDVELTNAWESTLGVQAALAAQDKAAAEAAAAAAAAAARRQKLLRDKGFAVERPPQSSNEIHTFLRAKAHKPVRYRAAPPPPPPDPKRCADPTVALEKELEALMRATDTGGHYHSGAAARNTQGPRAWSKVLTKPWEDVGAREARPGRVGALRAELTSTVPVPKWARWAFGSLGRDQYGVGYGAEDYEDARPPTF